MEKSYILKFEWATIVFLCFYNANRAIFPSFWCTLYINSCFSLQIYHGSPPQLHQHLFIFFLWLQSISLQHTSWSVNYNPISSNCFIHQSLFHISRPSQALVSSVMCFLSMFKFPIVHALKPLKSYKLLCMLNHQISAGLCLLVLWKLGNLLWKGQQGKPWRRHVLKQKDFHHSLRQTLLILAK